MKIGEARTTYNLQIKEYYTKQKELYNSKKQLEDKIKSTENGVYIYKDEAAVLELQYDAVSKKTQEYQNYMDRLLEQWRSISDCASAEQQSDAMAEQAKEMGKILIVARRIMNGDKVPAKDEKKLMEFDPKLYALAKSAGEMAKQNKRKEHKSLWKDEEKQEYPNSMEIADNTEAFADGPQIVDVEITMENAVEGL